MTKVSKTNSTAITAAALMASKPTPTRFLVSNLLADRGLILTCARPKTGKSWWALALSMAVSNGSEFMGIPVSQGEVLYLALEDTLQRLRSRLAVLCQDDQPSDDLHFRLDYPRVGEGCVEDLDAWLKSHRRARLVVIDTWGKVAPRNGKSTYHHEYETLSQLKAIGDRRRVCIMLIHHLRKTAATNWTDEIQGSTAVSGTADCLLHLDRPRNGGEATLSGTGRDISEFSHSVFFNASTGKWSIIDDGHRDFLSPEARRCVDFVASAAGPVMPRQVSDSLDLNPHSTRRMMSKLSRQRVLVRTIGGYTVAMSDDQRSSRSPRSPGDDDGDEGRERPMTAGNSLTVAPA